MYHVNPLFTLVSLHLICIFVNIFPHFSFDGPYHVNPLFTLSLLGNIFSAQIICIFVKIFTHFSFDEPSSPSFQSRRTLEKFVNIWFYSRDWKTCILGKYFCVVTVMGPSLSVSGVNRSVLAHAYTRPIVNFGFTWLLSIIIIIIKYIETPCEALPARLSQLQTRIIIWYVYLRSQPDL